MKKEKIIGTAEAWENGDLGHDADHAVAAPAGLAQHIDDVLGMQMISIRLPKELIEEYKMIAQVYKLAYQPLMRDALKRFAEAEMKKLAVQYANEKAAKEKTKSSAEQCEVLEPASATRSQAKPASATRSQAKPAREKQAA